MTFSKHNWNELSESSKRELKKREAFKQGYRDALNENQLTAGGGGIHPGLGPEHDWVPPITHGADPSTWGPDFEWPKPPPIPHPGYHDEVPGYGTEPGDEGYPQEGDTFTDRFGRRYIFKDGRWRHWQSDPDNPPPPGVLPSPNDQYWQSEWNN